MVLGHSLGFGIAGRMTPGDLLSNIDALDRGAWKSKYVGVDARRTGSDDHGVDDAFGDIFADQLGVLEAERARRLHDRSGELAFGDFGQAVRCETLADTATRTDINAEFLGHRTHPLAAVWIAPIAFITAAVASWTAVATSTGLRAQPAA